MAKPVQYCPNCGTVAAPVKLTRGSIWIELVLWILFLIPGLLYSIWRLTTRQRVCPACKHPNMIPTDSPRAQEATRRPAMNRAIERSDGH